MKINTPGKLASLVVKITSSTLEALLPAVGLTSEFDICDEGLKETLSKLGLSAQKVLRLQRLIYLLLCR